jgi:RNA polymerase sigma factor (sigma-70 family)
MQPVDDNALLRQYVESSSDEAFAALVTRHINLVYSVALRHVGNSHNAEEITQAVFIILAKKAARLREVKALSSWLFQVTRLTANNFVRSESRRHCREQEAHMQSILNKAETELWPRIAPLLDTAVAGLREKDRQAIVLRFYEGRNLRQIGLVLGASEDAAEKRVSRALEKLRNFFTKRGVTSTTAIIAGAISTNSIQAAPVVLAKSVTAIAVTKGAAASGSTLTLIKGALKIMAWTKIKTAVVAGVIILAVAGTTTMFVQHERQQLPKPQPVASGETEFPKASWHFAGYANPESAFQSCMWAVANGDAKTLLAGLAPAMHEKLMGKPAIEIIPAKDKADFAKMSGYKILDKQVLSENEVMFEMYAEGLDQTQTFSVQRIGNEWRFAGKANQ